MCGASVGGEMSNTPCAGRTLPDGCPWYEVWCAPWVTMSPSRCPLICSGSNTSICQYLRPEGNHSGPSNQPRSKGYFLDLPLIKWDTHCTALGVATGRLNHKDTVPRHECMYMPASLHVRVPTWSCQESSSPSRSDRCGASGGRSSAGARFVRLASVHCCSTV